MVNDAVQDLARALHVSPTVFYTLAFSTFLVAALVVGFALNRILHYWSKKFGDSWGELIFSLLESLPLPLMLLAAVYSSLELLTLPRQIERAASKLILALVIIVIFYFPAKALMLFLRRLGRREPGLRQVTQPAVFIVRALFALLAVVIVLENLGISLTGIWTTLGVGSVAVALALQETLSNLFAGFYLMVDRSIRSGDYIKLEPGPEGSVERIGWRSTALHTPNNNTVFIPNSAMAKAMITNYSLPEPRVGLTVPVGVAYGTPPERVEKALLDVAREAVRDGVVGLVTASEPVVLLNPGFGASSLDFSLSVDVRRVEDLGRVQSELRKRILARFAKDGIVMTYPTRRIFLEKSTPDVPAESKN